MPTIVQHKSNKATINIPPHSTISGSVSATFTSNTSTGNSILVACAGEPGNAGMTVLSPVYSDNQSNTYGTTLMAYAGGGFRDDGIGIEGASTITPGATTVTVTFQCFNPNFVFTQSSTIYIAIAELQSGPITANASGNQNVTSGNVVITLTSLGGTNVTTTIGAGSGLSFYTGAVCDIVSPGNESFMAVGSGGAATFPPSTSVSPSLFAYGTPIETQSPIFSVWWSAGIPTTFNYAFLRGNLVGLNT